MSQRQFGPAVGSSHRSAVRWDGGGSTPGAHHLHNLARLLDPRDRALAAEVADASGQTLETLGLETAADPLVSKVNLVDLLVLTAVEQSGSLPAAVRPWLHAIMKRGVELRLTMEAAEEALRPAAPEAAEATDEDRKSPK